MKKTPIVYIEDMLEAIDLATSYLQGISEVKFSQDIQLQDAVLRRLAIIGEAASKMPQETKDKAQEIPWPTIIGFRNVIIHDYSGVSMGRVWEITQKDLPELKENLEKLRQLVLAP